MAVLDHQRMEDFKRDFLSYEVCLINRVSDSLFCKLFRTRLNLLTLILQEALTVTQFVQVIRPYLPTTEHGSPAEVCHSVCPGCQAVLIHHGTGLSGRGMSLSWSRLSGRTYPPRNRALRQRYFTQFVQVVRPYLSTTEQGSPAEVC